VALRLTKKSCNLQAGSSKRGETSKSDRHGVVESLQGGVENGLTGTGDRLLARKNSTEGGRRRDQETVYKGNVDVSQGHFCGGILSKAPKRPSQGGGDHGYWRGGSKFSSKAMFRASCGGTEQEA